MKFSYFLLSSRSLPFPIFFYWKRPMTGIFLEFTLAFSIKKHSRLCVCSLLQKSKDDKFSPLKTKSISFCFINFSLLFCFFFINLFYSQPINNFFCVLSFTFQLSFFVVKSGCIFWNWSMNSLLTHLPQQWKRTHIFSKKKRPSLTMAHIEPEKEV